MKELEWFNLIICSIPLFLAGLVSAYYLFDRLMASLGVGEDDGETM